MSDTQANAPVLRIAMWSGPRNISTAMMRSFGNRPDCYVCDEPFYAHYLSTTQLPHPGADLTLKFHETEWENVVQWLLGPVPDGRSVWYQKHMAHHLLPDVDRGWLNQVTNCFLIREPREMVTSLLEFIRQPVISDTGLPQQLEIFERVREQTGEIPVVIDAKDVLLHPAAMLDAVCDRLGIPFTDAMLRWPPGLRDTDGAWAKHWYAKVEKTTGFTPYQPKDDIVPESLMPLLAECEAIYQTLLAHRLTV